MSKSSKMLLLVIAVIVAASVLYGIRSTKRAPAPLKGLNAESTVKDRKIAVIEVNGPIMDSKDLIENILDVKKDDSIKGVILRVNTPGGAIAPTQEIFEELKKLDKKKPVFTSMGTVAASGGYYIACGTRKVFANPGTITGSIGVIFHFMHFEKILEKLQITNETIKSGEHKDIGSPFKAPSDSDRLLLQSGIATTYNQFLRAVSTARKIKIEELKKIADGRIIMGEDAQTLRLIDELGNLQDTIEAMKKAIGIKETEEAEIVYPQEKKKKFIQRLFGDVSSSIKQQLPLSSAYLGYFPDFSTID